MAIPKTWNVADASDLINAVTLASAKTDIPPEARSKGGRIIADGTTVLVKRLDDDHNKIDKTRPYWVLLKDDATDFSFLEVVFFDGKRPKSVLRSDLMGLNDFNVDIVKTLNDLNNDYKLDSQWKIDDLIRESQKESPETGSSLGEFDEAIIIGFAQPFNEIGFIPFGNWDVAPEFLEPETEIVEEDFDYVGPDKEDNPYKNLPPNEPRKKGWEDYNPWMKEEPHAATQANIHHLNK